MKQIFIIITVCLSYCTGCTPPPQAPVWETVKFKDLTRSKHSVQNTLELPQQFNMYLFALPAENFPDVKDIWSSLSTKPIQFISKNSFDESGFVAGVGNTRLWEPIAKKLRAADGKNLKTIDLVIFNNNSEYVSLLPIETEKNIFYRTQDNQINGATLGPGETMLRLTAATPPDVRGVCKLTIEPMFKNAAKPQSASDAADLIFTAATCSARMSPGDFILLGPASYASHDMTLGSIFFSSPKTSTVQIYLFICTGVSN